MDVIKYVLKFVFVLIIKVPTNLTNVYEYIFLSSNTISDWNRLLSSIKD